MRKTRKKVFKGGKVIASGGFGCVFRPALKCKDSKNINDGYISKLMLNKYAEREYKLVKQAYEVVKNIPNFKRYFLVYDYNMCQPSYLSSNDLVDYDLKCKDTLPDSSNYINKNLSNYKIINSPDGGIDLSYWLDNSFGKYASSYTNNNLVDLLWNINTSLVNLLNNGIYKLKNFSYYHMDIKAQNILVKEDGLSSKLIDYGLAFKHNSNKVPDELKNRALLFNTPFTILLFQKPFIEILLKKVNKTFNIENNKYLIDDSYGRKVLLQPIVLESMKEFISDINSGHWKYLQYFYKDLFEQLFEENEDGEAISHFNQQLSSDYYRFKFISEYITEACNKFLNWKSSNITFNEDQLWNKVFKYNVDIFGFLTVYQNIITSSSLTKYRYKSLTGNLDGWKNISLFQKRVIEILGEYLLNPDYAIKPFPENKLIEDLRELGDILSSATSNPSQFKKSPIWNDNYIESKNKTRTRTRKTYKAGKNKNKRFL